VLIFAVLLIKTLSHMKLYHVNLQPVKYKIDIKSRVVDSHHIGFSLFSTGPETYQFEECLVTVRYIDEGSFLISAEFYSIKLGRYLVNIELNWHFTNRSIEAVLKIPKHQSHYLLYCLR
jgi:hypothetical protein